MMWESLLIIGIVLVGLIAGSVNYDRFYDWLDKPMKKKGR